MTPTMFFWLRCSIRNPCDDGPTSYEMRRVKFPPAWAALSVSVMPCVPVLFVILEPSQVKHSSSWVCDGHTHITANTQHGHTWANFTVEFLVTLRFWSLGLPPTVTVRLLSRFHGACESEDATASRSSRGLISHSAYSLPLELRA